MIEIERLSRRFGAEQAVEDVSLTLETGTITAVVGASGSGKSTLLRMVNRLVEPDEGTVRIDGVDARDIPLTELRRRIGYVIQDHGLFPHWSVARNIGAVPALLGWPRAEIAARTEELMALLQLDPRLGARYPHELSGGQAQRVGVARALAARPRMMLMDEPFGALDPVIRQEARTALLAIQRRLGATVLMVTHDMAEALSLGDQIAVMDGGRLLQAGAPAEIVLRPATEQVRALIGEGERGFRHLALLPVAAALRPAAEGSPGPSGVEGPPLDPGVADRRLDPVAAEGPRDPDAAEGQLDAGAAEGPPLDAGASLADALSRMIWTGRRRLPARDAAGEPAGVVTLEDLLAAGRGPR